MALGKISQQQQQPAVSRAKARPHVAPAGTRAPPNAKSGQPAGNLNPFNAKAPQLERHDPKPGNGVPSFKTSFDASGKGGGSFRPISENFAVNPANGTLSLSIPIYASPTRGGFGPELQLDYNSGAGNGPFGFGWNISFPAVSRKTNRGFPTYVDDSDDLALSGAEIVPTLTAKIEPDVRSIGGFDVARYRPTIDSGSMRIEKWTRKDDILDVHWRTITSNNVTTIYGDNDACRIFDILNGCKRIFSWMLSRSYDDRGNAIEYVYKSEDGKGIEGNDGTLPSWERNRSAESRCTQRYMKRIKYGNRFPCRKVASWEDIVWPDEWMFELVFDYADHHLESPATMETSEWAIRKDAFSQSIAGFEVRSYRLCRRILMYHHFPEFTKRPESLVRSTTFDYDEKLQRSTLSAVSTQGHSFKGEGDEGVGQYKTEDLPQWTFAYSPVAEPETVQTLQADARNLLTIPNIGFKNSTWLDLNGDGVPGLLSRLSSDTLVYQRNHGSQFFDEGRGFLPPVTLDRQPSLESLNLGRFEDLDGNGKVDYVCLDDHGTPVGFYEREDADSWSSYSSFPQTPVETIPAVDPKVIDLTGDGHPDLLFTADAQTMAWQQSLGKQGSSQWRRTYSSHSSQLPNLTDTGVLRTYVADMTGDGLSDLVEVSASKVVYWSNLGYGCFGAPVEMGNCPLFHQYGEFDYSRLLLADIDGSGTTDMLYTLPNDGALLFYNYAGNSWSDAIFISGIKKSASASPFFVLDILGKGTASICWAEISNSANTTQIKFVDLMGDVKPHLLSAYSNGLGAKIFLKYAPSTRSSQEDEFRGRPWTTKLPFPVQCISQVEVQDEMTGNRAWTDYSYHNGCYDPTDREFAGFEMVETWNRERIVIGNGETFETQVLYTKSWYNVGLSLHVNEDDYVSPSKIASYLQSVSNDSTTRALKALRGSHMRTETYAQNGSEKTQLPYSVHEFSYEVMQVQAQAPSKHPVVSLTPKASLNTEYERNICDPRVTHEIVLKKNDYGDIEESLRVIYPRSRSATASLDHEDVKKNHLAGNVTFLRTQYTNTVDEQRVYRKPLPWRHMEYEILEMSLPTIPDLEAFQRFDFKSLSNSKGTSPWKSLRSQDLTLYRASSLSETLKGGVIEAFSVPHQSYTLSLMPEILAKAQQSLVTHEITTALETNLACESGYLPAAELVDKVNNGHVDAKLMTEGIPDGSFWAPSHVASFRQSPHVGDELKAAREGFYTPLSFSDVFGRRSTIEMDQCYLLVRCVEDAIGNTTVFENDYEQLQPFKITDPNLITQQVALDPVGRVIATAMLGKSNGEEDDVDSFENFQLDASPEEIALVLQDPCGVVARRLLGNCGQRVLYFLHQPNVALRRSIFPSKESDMVVEDLASQTSLMVEIDRNLSFQQSGDSKLRVTVTYPDGLGNVLQKASLNDPANAQQRWLLSGVTAIDFNGNSIRVSNPQFASTPDVLHAANMPEINSTFFFDALGRHVGSVFPDHTWSKTIYTPWSLTEYDLGNTLFFTDPHEDPDVGLYFKKLKEEDYLPSWPEAKKRGTIQDKLAAEKSVIYSDALTITHFGCCGLPVRQAYTAGGKSYHNSYEYDFSGNRIRTFDSYDRLVEKNIYDQTNRPLSSSGMDSGETWTIQKVDGRPFVSWNSRGICFQYLHDALGREIEKRMHRGSEPQKTVVKTVYGEDQAGATANNLKGQIWQIMDQAGIHTNVRFDSRGQCVEQTLQPAREYKFELDWQADNEIVMSTPPFKHERSFDNYGRTIWEKDAVGNCTRRTFSRLDQEQSVDFSVKDSKSWAPYLVSTSFSADGLPLRMEYGNGAVSQFAYDDKSRHLISQKTSRRSTTGRRDVLENLSHTYDCEGRLIRSFDHADQSAFFQNCRIDPVWEYTYDAVGRLVTAEGRGQLPSAGGKHVQLQPSDATNGSKPTNDNDGTRLYSYRETYAYDLEGNILSLKHEAPQDSFITGWTRLYCYQEPSLLSRDPKVANNRLSNTSVGSVEENYGYSGDAGRVGCMTSLPKYSQIKWDMNNMMSVSSTQIYNAGTPEMTYYAYDHAGNRIRKITECAAAPNSTPRMQRDTLCWNGVEIQTKFQAGGLRAASTRSISSIAGQTIVALVETTDKENVPPLVRYQIGKDMELDESAQLITYEEYSPFGSVVYSAMYRDIEAPRKYRFARYEHDRETGLYHCGARYYCPWLGRWTSPDPLGTSDGLNVFAHVSNDPLDWVDPEGTSGSPKNTNCRSTLSTPTTNVEPKTPSNKKKSSAQDSTSHKTRLESPDNDQWQGEAMQSQSEQFEPQDKRRNATENFKKDIKSPTDLLAYHTIIQDAVSEELGWWGRLMAGKGEIARKAAVLLLATSLGLVPVAGHALKAGVNALASHYERELELEKRKTEDIKLIALGIAAGKETEHANWQKRLAEIATLIDLDDALDTLVSLGFQDSEALLVALQEKAKGKVKDPLGEEEKICGQQAWREEPAASETKSSKKTKFISDLNFRFKSLSSQVMSHS